MRVLLTARKFVDLLAAQNPDAHFDIFYASEYQLPKSVDDYDGYMLSGSPVSANDDFDWIDDLSQFVVAANKKEQTHSRQLFWPSIGRENIWWHRGEK